MTDHHQSVQFALPRVGQRIQITAPITGVVGRTEYDIPVGATGTALYSEGSADDALMGVALDHAFGLADWVVKYNREEGLHPFTVEFAWWEGSDPTKHAWKITDSTPKGT